MEEHCRRLLWLLVVCGPAAAAASRQCDWAGSGLAHGAAGHVTAVSLDCGAGRVQWRYPQGALRISLDPSNAREFRACLRFQPGSGGARVFLETRRGRLRLLWSEDDGRHTERWRCFGSHEGRAALYLEAPSEVATPLVPTAVTFQYDAEPTADERVWDKLEDCRPCSDSEALLSFCMSDFVVRGRITAVEHSDPLDRSGLTVKASRVIRQTNDIFRAADEPEAAADAAGDLSNHISPRYRTAAVFDDRPVTSDQLKGEVFVPRHCGAHPGHGQYLLMGRHRLGVPVVSCSLSVQEWQRIRRDAEAADTNECVLQT